MRVIPWSVELLLGTPGRWSLAHIHTFQVQAHNTAKHRRLHATPASTSPRNGLLHASAPLTGAGGNISGDTRRYVHQSTSPGNVSSHRDDGDDGDSYRTRLDSLLAALRQCDTLKLYFCLLEFTRGASLHNQSFCQVVQTIPPTTFSEILRHFDPFRISSHVDSAPGIAISWGAALYSPLGDLINKWGVKILYVRILNRLRLLQRARRGLPRIDGSPSQSLPLLRDYLVLLRCAGATSDIRVAKTVWWELLADGYGDWKHAELFAEFIKARYLTEALYANNDLSRFRLRPLDMHRSSIKLGSNAVRRLSRLDASLIDVHSHRFGHNVNEYYFAEPLTRMLRKRKPLMRIERRALLRRMIPGDESILCAILKANGRHGRLYASNVLMRFWGINISIHRSALGNREISGGHDFSLGSAMAPTEALLDAVVHCYGNMGEVLLGKALVDFISRRWGIAVPDKVWSDLLGFARVQSTVPAIREWRLAQLPRKVLSPDAVLDLWHLCTQEPHNFKPSMKDYYSLLKSLIGPQRPLDQVLEAIRQVRPLYDRAAQQVETAWAELILTTQQNVPNHAAYRRYRVLQSSKHHMWYCFHYTARQVFNKLSPTRVDSPDAVRHIPDLVAEMEPFLRATTRYRIATGIVDLRLDHIHVRTVMAQQTLHHPGHRPGPLSRSPKVREWSTDRTSRDQPLDMEQAALEELPNEVGSHAALRDYQEMIDNEQGNERQLENDEHKVDEEEEEDAGQESLYAAHEKKTQHERVVSRTRKPERRVQDAFDESRNPAYEPPVADDLGTASKLESVLSEDAFADAFSFHHQDNVENLSALQYTNDWDKDDPMRNAVALANRRLKAKQLVERPAYKFRPRYGAPPGEPSLSALRQDGQEFTGFHDDPLKAHFAAHRIVRGIIHSPGAPVNLGGPGVSMDKVQFVEDLLDKRT